MGLDMYLHNSKDEEVAYWRKANQIRAWLVNEGIIKEDDNCTERKVTTEQLQRLVDDCKSVLEDHSKAETLLPTSSGFFFGGTEYDEWYFDDLKETVNMLTPLLKTDETYTYSDWW